jgi:hypothetical protein
MWNVYLHFVGRKYVVLFVFLFLFWRSGAEKGFNIGEAEKRRCGDILAQTREPLKQSKAEKRGENKSTSTTCTNLSGTRLYNRDTESPN